MIVPKQGPERLKVTCESPARLPMFTRVIIRHPATGTVFNHTLADAMTFYNQPVITWLSPLNREQTFVQIGPLRDGVAMACPGGRRSRCRD